MKDNFDFIKQKFDTDNITTPNDINADFVMSKIDGKSQKRVKFSTKKVFGGLAGLVACVAIAAIAINSTLAPNLVTPAPVVAEASELVTFEDYDSIKKTLKDMGVSSNMAHNIDQMKDGLSFGFGMSKNDTALSESSSDVASDDFGQTYLQVNGVDEGDIIKTDGKNIYYATHGVIYVYSAKGKDSKEISTIKIKNDDIYDLYLNGDKLIVNTYDFEDNKTVTTIYDKSDAKNIKKLDTFAQSGSYTSSRMIGTNIYIVSNQYIHTQNDVPYITCKGKDAKLNAKAISCIENPTEPEYLVISKIDTENLDSDTETKAILGASSNVYCNEDNMFITSTLYEHNELTTKDTKETTSDDMVDVEIIDDGFVDARIIDKTKTHIIKVNLTDGIKFVATAKVDGYTYDQYAMDEKDGNLRIVTTSTNDKGQDVNNLFVLNEKLEQIGKVDGFAPTESVKAVKYVGDIAYVITYEQTDPLFVIDLSNARKPKILGECKIEGFSTMLIPVGDDKLLGIGYYTEDHEDDDIDMEITEGIKLALFDISNKTSPRVIDEKVLKGYSSSVQYQPKALIYNAKKDMYIIPYYIDNYDYDDHDKITTGALCFSVEDKKLSSITEHTVTADDYETIERCTYVDDDLYMLTFNGELYTSSLK